MAQAKTDRLRIMEAAQELGQVGAGSDPYHDCAVADCNVKHVFAHEVTLCQRCRKETCYTHRFQDKHDCIKDRVRSTTTSSSPAPSNRPQESPCSKAACKIKIDPDKRKGDKCPKCFLVFCWTHQKDFMHECRPPQSSLLAKEGKGKGANPMDAFRSMFRAKNEARKTGPPVSSSPAQPSQAQRKPTIPSSVSNRISAFRRSSPNVPAPSTQGLNIKGSSIPKEKRILIHLQAEAPRTTFSDPAPKPVKIPEIRAYFDKTRKVGQILDVACGYLSLENNNNKDPDPANWWSFYNLNRQTDPIPTGGDVFGEFAKEGDQLILMKGLAAFIYQT